MGAKDSRLDLLQYQAGRTKAGETSSPEPPLPGSLEASHAWSRARRDSFLSIKHRPMRTGRSAGKTLRVTDGEQTGAATGRRGGAGVTSRAPPAPPPPLPARKARGCRSRPTAALEAASLRGRDSRSFLHGYVPPDSHGGWCHSRQLSKVGRSAPRSK